MTDRASGKPALLFGLDLIDCVWNDCRFRGSYYEGNLSAQGNVPRAPVMACGGRDGIARPGDRGPGVAGPSCALPAIGGGADDAAGSP